MERIPLKGSSQEEVEEGEIPWEKTRKSGRISHRDVEQETTNKENYEGKQHSIESSLNNMGRKGGNKCL